MYNEYMISATSELCSGCVGCEQLMVAFEARQRLKCFAHGLARQYVDKVIIDEVCLTLTPFELSSSKNNPGKVRILKLSPVGER